MCLDINKTFTYTAHAYLIIINIKTYIELQPFAVWTIFDNSIFTEQITAFAQFFKFTFSKFASYIFVDTNCLKWTNDLFALNSSAFKQLNFDIAWVWQWSLARRILSCNLSPALKFNGVCYYWTKYLIYDFQK